MHCISPMNNPAVYLGLLESTSRGITLLLHAYQEEGELYTSYSAVGPRKDASDPEILLSKEEQWAPMARSTHTRITLPFVGICTHCSGELPSNETVVFVQGCGLFHTTCFAVPE